jgi:DNA-binding FadR family transcriptional regulator
MNPNEPIKKRKLSDEVLDRLLMLFESGELKADDEMPSERELMERFQVGRPAVREALQSLERMGLILIRHGGRAKVLKPTEDRIFNQIDFAARQLLASSDQNVEFLKEARQILEAGIAQLAAERSTPAEVDELGRHLESMRRNIGKPKKFLKADQEFHLTLSQMTHNPILLTTMRAVFKWLEQYHADLLGVAGLENLTLQEHEAIFKKIVDRDAEGAVRQISEHIPRINDLYPKTHRS